MEGDLWKTLRKAIGPLGDLQRIENVVGSGMPDLNGCIDGKEFWCEMKWLPHWPRRENTVVRIPHYTPQQRAWIRRRGEEGRINNVFLLLQIFQPCTYMLFAWREAYLYVSLVPRAKLIKNALIYHEGSFPASKVLAHFLQLSHIHSSSVA